MHILINGNFWGQPTVGSGQYLHGLIRWLPRVAPHHRYTLLVPATTGSSFPPPPPPVTMLVLRTPFDGQNENLAKLWFEQISIPTTVHLFGRATLLHVPYFAPPLRCARPVITTIPDIIPLRLPAYRGGMHVQAYMALVSQAARASQHIITFSDYSRVDIATALQIPLTRLTTTLLAADERYTPPTDRAIVTQQLATHYQLTSPYIYYVGGLDVRKNVGILVRAFAQIQQHTPCSATLVIAGRSLGNDPRLFPDLDALIAATGMTPYVRRIEVPHADGPLLYQGCTVFAFPSHYEGFGLPPLEAMACGAPVVVSNASSLPEVVGDAALCIDPDDLDGWANGLRTLLDDAALRESLRMRGLARAAQFSWQRVAEETAQIYDRYV